MSNRLTFCPVCGKRGLQREQKEGGSVFLHGKNQVWKSCCYTVDQEGRELFREVHKGRWVKVNHLDESNTKKGSVCNV